MYFLFALHDRRRFALAFALALAALGCGSEAGSPRPLASRRPGDSPFSIVATTSMVTDVIRILAGDQARVDGLMGEGIDPHLYKPTRNAVLQLTRADAVFYSGLLLEGRMADTLDNLARQRKPVYAVTAGLDPGYVRAAGGAGGHPDPHVWMDVSAWSRCVAHAAKLLSEFDPAHAADYASRAQTYLAELDGLHAYAQQSIASIPEPQRVLVTAHDAFGYFSRAYDIPVRSPQGLSTESEAGVDDINRLVEFLVARKVRAIFVESTVSEKNIRAIVEGAQQKGWTVGIGGNLFSDAMGAPGTYEGTYVGMIDHNVTVITRALGGQAPPRGWKGKLDL